ncbi:MAG: hypothetical protein PUJ11_00575 [Eubacteriaceae bacterium]|nr:hypothetical protein [Eubacteriaceae bacterium]
MAVKLVPTHKYDDIINMPHHQSKTRPHMNLQDRAAQFGSFAALTGHKEAVAEEGRLTDSWVELDETEKISLDRGLLTIREALHVAELSGVLPSVKVVFFQPDEHKDGGCYESYSGAVKKIRDYERRLVFETGMEIDIDMIRSIESEF